VKRGFVRAVATCFLPFAAGYLLSYVFRTVNAVVGPRIANELGIDIASLGVLTAAYFAGFVLLQIPAGVLLDQVGPRVTQVGLLLVAALGAVIFATGTSLAGLTLGRALIGAGVAACLMSGFKANAMFWPPERLGIANGTLMSFAGIGAAIGTLPVTWLADALGWRGLFWLLGGVAVLLAGLVHAVVPRRDGGASGGLGEALQGVREVFAAPVFWRVVPLSATTQGVFQAYHTLWTAPWLVDVAGVAPDDVAGAMLIIVLGIMPGYILSGGATDALSRRGVSHRTIFASYTAAFMLLQIPLALGVVNHAIALWFAFVVLGTGSVIGYVIITPHFKPVLTGRVNTGVNMCVFIVAFVIQASIGHALAWIETRWGLPRATAHGPVMWSLIALQALSWIWFLLPARRP
jgi:predicted MFS family arabinose efflux permease